VVKLNEVIMLIQSPNHPINQLTNYQITKLTN